MSNIGKHSPSIRLALILLALLGFLGCSDEEAATPQPEYTTAAAYLESSGWQGSVFIQRGQEILLDKGYGLADRQSGQPNDGDLKYRIGSMTKAFTAMAVVQLKNQGLIQSFDDPVALYFPDYPRGDEITLRHLLTHRSGLPDYLEFVDSTQPHDPEELVGAVMDQPLHFTPGTAVEYSNTNFAALGILIEELSGQSYFSFLQTSVLQPLGLGNTSYGSDPITAEDEARGYNGNTGSAPLDMSVPYAAGALVSNMGDLRLWARAILDGQLISPEDRSDVFPAAPDQDGHNNVGMGWFILNDDGITVYQHGGDINGFTSLMALIPGQDGIILMLGNDESQYLLRYEIMEQILAHEFH